MNEASVSIDGVTLSFGQVMAMRVAISNMLIEVSDPEYANKLGFELAAGYAARLREVEKLLVDGGNHQIMMAKRFK